MELDAAKAIGAGIAAISLGGAGIGIGHIFGNYLSGAMRHPAAAAAQRGTLFLGFAFAEATGLIGFAVGSQFRPYMIRRLPRVTFFGMISVGLLGIVMIGFSFLVGAVSSVDVTTAILATSPGGMSEMAATAQALHLVVSTVVAFQIVRALTVNSFAVHVWTGLSRAGFFARLEKLFGKRPDPA